MKVLVFDSGTLITLSMNCLLDFLRDLKKVSKVKMLITKEVEEETVRRPMNIKKYKLGALKIKALIDEGVLEFPEAVGISKNEISKFTQQIMKEANTTYFQHDNPIHIIDLGESSILALSEMLEEKGIENLIAIDERTTRLLCEKPENLKDLLERRLHTRITQKKEADKRFSNERFIRSTELIYVAFKKGLFESKDKEFLDALLFAAKFKGAAISGEEIMQIERLV